MEFNELSPELQEKVRACQTPDELLELVKEEGYELSDEEMEGVAGGSWCSDHEWGCPADNCNLYGIGR